jgi:plasmid stability protein
MWKGVRMATLNLRQFPDDLHDALRIAAAKRKASIKELMILAARAWLQQQGELPVEPTKKAKGRPARTGRPL